MTQTKPSAGLSRRSLLGAGALAPAAVLAPSLLESGAYAQSGATPGAGVHKRMIGDIEVIALLDGHLALPTALLSGFNEAEGETAAKLAYRSFNPEAVQTSVNGYIIRTGDRVIAVDCGTPKAIGDTVGNWQSSLAAARIDPSDIDTLFLTHAHIDHVGGMSSDQGERFLQNAQLVLSDVEWGFTHDDAILNAIPADFVPMFHMARALIAPYADGRHEVAMGQEVEIAPGVTTVPLPGHTPGHLGLRVESGGEALLIIGDVIHTPIFQFSHPDWSIVFDADPGVAGKTRGRVLDMASSDRLMVAGMHLDFPAVGYIERLGDGYRYVSAPPDYRI